MNKIHIASSPNDVFETYKMVELFRSINQELKKLGRDETEIKKQLSGNYFASHDEFIYEGRLLLTYDARSRSDIDRDKLEREYPEAFANCQKTLTYKQFSLK